MFVLPSNSLPARFALALGIAWAYSLGSTTAVHGQQERPIQFPEIESVQVGYEGKYKVGHWTPVRVTIRGGSRLVRGRVELQLPDGEGIESRITQQQAELIEIPAGGHASILRYAKFGRVHGGLTVDVIFEDGRPISRRIPAGELPAGVLGTQQLVVVVGGDVGAADAVRRRPRTTSEAIVTAAVDRVSGLPDHWLGYSGVDVLVLATGEFAAVEDFRPEQLAALQQWVGLGGRLLLCVGSQGERLFKSAGGLAALVPGRLAQVTRLTESPRLESYAGATVPLGQSAKGGDEQTSHSDVTMLANIEGQVLVEERGRQQPIPLIVRAPWGLGQVLFCAFDLEQPPFASWPDRGRLVARLLDLLLGGSTEGIVGRNRGQVSHVGIEDLTGQLRAALDQFSGVSLVPFALIVALSVLFIVVTGPVDYYLLHNGLGRPGWTWLTLPASIVAICAVAFYLAHRWKGNELRLNQVDLVDVDMASGYVRGTNWCHVFSPHSDAIDLSIEPRALSAEGSREAGRALSWQGLAGESFGGMNSPTAAAFGTARYSIVEATTDEGQAAIALKDFPIPIWSSRGLIGQWWTQKEPGEASRLSANQDGLLKGEITNPLTEQLVDCTLLHGRWAYPLGQLRPKSTVPIAGQPRNVEWLLTQRRIVETQDVTTPWDQRSFDVPRIMQMMMFHDAAGGQAYTELLHRFQRTLDMTGQLEAGRAILMGRGEEPASQLLRDGEPLGENAQHWTFYRIVYPVGAHEN